MIRQAARDFAQRELLQDVIERDTHGIYPSKHIESLKQLGFFGMMVSPDYGGHGMDALAYVMALEEISKIDSSVAVIMSVHNSLVCLGVEKYGSKQQKDH